MIEHPLWILTTSIILILVLVAPVQDLQFDSSSEIWFLEEDKTLENFERYKVEFAPEESLLLAVNFKQPPNLQEQKQLIDFIPQINTLKYVANVQFYPIVQSANQLYIINLEYPSKEQYSEVNKLLVNSVKLLAEKEWINPISLHYGGIAVNAAFHENAEYDQQTLSPIFFTIVLLLLFFIFRTMVSLGIVCFIIFATTACSYGVLALLDWKITPLTNILILIVVAASINDAVHLLIEFYAQRRDGIESKAAAQASFKKIFQPCFYTTLTTCAGFVALSFTRLPPVQEFGVVAAISVCFALLFTLFPMCSILQYSKKYNPISKGWIGAKRFTHYCIKLRCTFLLITLLLTFFAFYSASNIVVDVKVNDYFDQNSTMAKDLTYFSEHYGNGYPVEFIYDKQQNIKDELIFAKELIQAFKQMPGIVNVVSMPTSLPEGYTENSFINEIKANKWLSDSEGKMRIKINIAAKSDLEFIKALTTFTPILKRYKERQPFITGSSILNASMNDYIIEGLTVSFGLALLITSIFLFLFFRSFAFSILATFLCIWPILVASSLMPLFDIKLNLTTMLIAAITFCVVVDDSIHIISRYIKSRQNNLAWRESLQQTLTYSGKAVFISSIILCFAFGINIFGRHQPTVEFGILASAITLLALMANTAIFSSIIGVINIRKNKH